MGFHHIGPPGYRSSRPATGKLGQPSMGQGPYGPEPILAKAHMGQGPYALGPSLLGEHLTKKRTLEKRVQIVFFVYFWETKKMRDVRTIILAAVSRRDLCYVSENEGFRF